MPYQVYSRVFGKDSDAAQPHHQDNNDQQTYDSSSRRSSNILPGSIVGVSNSMFARPWRKVEIGVSALEQTLNKGLDIFGTGDPASYNPSSSYSSTTSHIEKEHSSKSVEDDDDDTKELAWLVI
ncbi:MAG: hypothetical protein BYD32DRAFT_476230 [Podila humilis]|nr:MAG: hypothetical protein BYD32DRAFT_476230 [Podila humilis]